VQEIRALIREVGATRTVLFSTHVLAEVEATCRRALVIRAGKIVADGPIDDLKRKAARGAVRVRFRPGNAQLPPREQLTALLAPLAAKVQPVADEAWVLEPSGTSSEDLAATLFKFANEKQLTLIELAPLEASLEDVFLTLAGAR
jgi:ABC-2 type transport system ATP-binding protein